MNYKINKNKTGRLAFKYESNNSINLVIPASLQSNLEFISNSRIDSYPIFRTTDGLLIEESIQDILNRKDKDKLKVILRQKKLEKIIKKENLSLTLNYEFLNFWYSNFDDLTTMMPIGTSDTGPR